jgi:beta-amylase
LFDAETTPKNYDFSGYMRLAELVKASGLRLEVVMSFHRCGGNVGDNCNVTLPRFVWDSKAGRDVFYQDAEGDADDEYLSLGVDNVALFAPNGRTGVDLYADFMRAFARAFAPHLTSGLVDEVQVGLGPAGELRYPSYQLAKWQYCGVGEFQCGDPFMRADLARAARQHGRPEWGNGPPRGAGAYNSRPNKTEFFSLGTADNFASEYGRFFLGWYADALVGHGAQVLAAANDAFGPFGVAVAAKISGIHWHYAHPSHAAELTAGYYNANGNNGYGQLAAMLKKANAAWDFTCLEMTDDPNSECDTRPEQLVKQTMQAAFENSIHYSGENAVSCPLSLSLSVPFCRRYFDLHVCVAPHLLSSFLVLQDRD